MKKIIFVFLLCVLSSNIRGQWVQRYNGPANSSDYSYSLVTDISGNAYVTGRSRGIGTGDD